MEYPLQNKLTSQQVLDYEAAFYDKGLADKALLTRSIGAVKAAVAAGWFGAAIPNPDAMEPVDIVELCTTILNKYVHTVFRAKDDLPNSPAASQTS